MRRAAFGLILLLAWGWLVGWAAHLPWSAPFLPGRQLNLAGADFHVVIGAGALDDQVLKIGSAGAESNALQSIELKRISAADFPILRYRFADFPRAMELSLVYRRADFPDDVQIVALPWPGSDAASYDLSSVADWRGEIIELGFAEFPTGQLVPSNYRFQPFTLVGAKLYSPSWSGSLAALATDWVGYWPWSQRSVHALGRDTDAPRAGSVNLVVSLGILLTVFAAWILLGWRGKPLAALACALVFSGWLLLDIRWQMSLWGKHQATRELYLDKPWNERAHLVADTEVLEASEKIRQLLRQEQATTRVLLHAGSNYESLRLYYHLLPINVGLLALAVTNPEHVALPAGAIVAFYDDDSWPFDADQQVLRPKGGGVIPASELLDAGALRAYRLRSAP